MMGLKNACEFSNVPVASGNASLYNTYKGKGIPPTLVIGMIGKLEDLNVPRPKKGPVYALGFKDFELEREKILWNEIERIAKSGHFVVSMHDFSTMSTLKSELQNVGLEMKLKIPKCEPAHQLVVVFGDVETKLPKELIGYVR